MHKVTLTYTFDENNILKDIRIEKDETQLSLIDIHDFLEAISNITKKAIENNKAQMQTENLLDELNIQRDEDT